ncbi:hypothetical protein U9M48_035612 [Paspalum notatum var. saurae]|uniref:Integrase catalytic domain-containing protein n=1 Tax=Paspalum notatum var. saurae TaxID=547442 RepID=A0AAQ3UCH3_PASNO
MHDGIVRTLTDVRHIPDMTKNLISFSTLEGNGYKYSGGDRVLKVSKGSLIDLKSANLYRLRSTTITSDVAVISNSLSNFDATNFWHMRLGHMSEFGLQVLSKRGLLDGHSIRKLKFCEHCVFGKHKRVKFNTSTHISKGILDYVWPYFLKDKSEAFSAFKQWMVIIENQTERKVKILRTDNGMEFCSNKFKEYCKSHGIVRHYTIPHIPQQNGVAKCMNRTNHLQSSLHRFWAKAASTPCYLNNCSPSKKTPIEVWSGSLTDYSQLRVFCCTAYAHVDNGKFEPRAIKCIFLGYQYGVKEKIEGNAEPFDYSEAITSVECNNWVTTMQTKMESLEKKGISPSEPARYKVRLVAKGYSQIPSTDFNDVFSPVVKHSSIRMLLSLVAMHDYELEQLDVKTAFLHGELEENIYMDQPEGFVIPGKENLVCKLKKSLYGLKQSPRQWYKRFDSFMLCNGFKRSDCDSCVYLKTVNGSTIYLLLYVDDMLIAAKEKSEIDKLKVQFNEEFEMKDLAATKKFLSSDGLEVDDENLHGLRQKPSNGLEAMLGVGRP